MEYVSKSSLLCTVQSHKSILCDCTVHFCVWLNLTPHIHAAEMLQLCVLHKLHVATAVCLVKVKLLILPLLCKRGTMWTRVRCGRRSGTADGYFNKAHGEDEELWNHYQVLVCVSWEGQWMPGQHCSNTPLPPPTTGQSVLSGGLSHSRL